MIRSGRLFNFWERLKNSLQDGKATTENLKTDEIVKEFTVDESKSDNNDNSLTTKVQKVFSKMKTKTKIAEIKE